jgi:hypothetical protein
MFRAEHCPSTLELINIVVIEYEEIRFRLGRRRFRAAYLFEFGNACDGQVLQRIRRYFGRNESWN